MDTSWIVLLWILGLVVLGVLLGREVVAWYLKTGEILRLLRRQVALLEIIAGVPPEDQDDPPPPMG